MAKTEERVFERNGMRITADVLVAINEEIYLDGSGKPMNIKHPDELTEDEPEKEVIIAGSKFSGPSDAYRNEFEHDETKPQPLPANHQEIFLGIKEVHVQQNGSGWELFEENMSDLLLELSELRKKTLLLERGKWNS